MKTSSETSWIAGSYQPVPNQAGPRWGTRARYYVKAFEWAADARKLMTTSQNVDGDYLAYVYARSAFTFLRLAGYDAAQEPR
jgi:hypothetical protein